MSRIGKQQIKIPAGVKVSSKGNVFSFEGPKGKLSHTLPKGINVKVDGDHVIVTRDEKVEGSDALFGLTRTLLANCVHGVHSAYSKGLEINGVGYRASVQGQTLNMTLGFSHPVAYTLPVGITAKVDANTKITITGADKQLVGAVSAQVRGLKPVEPYQGKGIRYAGEFVRRKAGKAAGAAGAAK
jgi:large subunit ribosomal protein L6